MKKKIKLIITCVIILLVGIKANSQITFDKKLEPNKYTDDLTTITKTDGTFYMIDMNNSEIELYDEKNNLYKKIKLPEYEFDTIKYSKRSKKLEHITIGQVGYIKIVATDKYFNEDNKIEFIITTKGISSNNEHLIKSYLINEDGQVIIKFEDINSSWIEFFGLKNKMIIYNDKSKILYNIKGGVLPWPFNSLNSTGTTNLKTIEVNKEKLNLTTIPNPNTGKATIIYELPENSTKGTIHLYSQQGELLKTYSVNNQQTELEISTEEYSSGTYFYELKTNGYSSGGKKMIVIN